MALRNENRAEQKFAPRPKRLYSESKNPSVRHTVWKQKNQKNNIDKLFGEGPLREKHKKHRKIKTKNKKNIYKLFGEGPYSKTYGILVLLFFCFFVFSMFFGFSLRGPPQRVCQYCSFWFFCFIWFFQRFFFGC